jgi:DNA-binding transcriptional LysR family regulator
MLGCHRRIIGRDSATPFGVPEQLGAMDRFEAMRVFTRVVERRNFTLAARDLGLPRSTVTEVVQQLEARLGVRLLHRTTRHVSTTLDGDAYYQRCLTLIADVEGAESAFRASNPRGLLRVEVHGTLARAFLLPTLPAFLEAYPDLRIHIGEGDRLVDPVREGVDCVLRVGEPKDSALIGRRVGLLEEVTCASPEYLKRHGTPGSPDDLEGHEMVGFVSSVTGTFFPLEFTGAGPLRRVTLPTRVSIVDAETNVALARLGLGLIQVPRYHVAADLEAGRLVEVLAEFPPTPSPVSVLYPPNRQLSPRVRVFIDWVTRTFSATKPSAVPAPPA